jgi:hypothetical protein
MAHSAINEEMDLWSDRILNIRQGNQAKQILVNLKILPRATSGIGCDRAQRAKWIAAKLKTCICFMKHKRRGVGAHQFYDAHHAGNPDGMYQEDTLIKCDLAIDTNIFINR